MSRIIEIKSDLIEEQGRTDLITRSVAVVMQEWGYDPNDKLSLEKISFKQIENKDGHCRFEVINKSAETITSSWRDEKMLPMMEMMAKNRNKTTEEMICQMEKMPDGPPMSEEEHLDMIDYFDAMDETGLSCMPMHDKNGTQYKDTANFLRSMDKKENNSLNIPEEDIVKIGEKERTYLDVVYTRFEITTIEDKIRFMRSRMD